VKFDRINKIHWIKSKALNINLSCHSGKSRQASFLFGKSFWKKILITSSANATLLPGETSFKIAERDERVVN
jgi:hypothetical protein